MQTFLSSGWYSLDTGHTVLVICASIILYYLTLSVFNLYSHPLAHFPGPQLWGGSRLTWLYFLWKGELPYVVRDLHVRYGPVVRVAPDELSFVSEDAWKTIYGHRESRRPGEWRGKLPGLNADNVISSSADSHARFRRSFNACFSEPSLQSQEPLINDYVSSMIGRLRKFCASDDDNRAQRSVKLAQWINFATFDIMGDFGWGKAFDCLRREEYHPWILAVLWYKGQLMGVTLRYFPWLDNLFAAVAPAAAQDGVKMVVETSRMSVAERLGHTDPRPDLISSILRFNDANPHEALSNEEIVANSSTIIVAGSDPLASVIAGALNYLLQTKGSLDKLEREIRSSFASEQDITMTSTKKLAYLHGVLLEALRLCPPVPDNMRRIVERNDTVIAGRKIPMGTTVGVCAFAAFRRADIFELPDEFRPERWLDDSGVSRIGMPSGFYPFGFGPRSCAGQALAWAEMRLILTRLIWNFNIQQDHSLQVGRWTDQKIFWTWQRNDLRVILHDRATDS